MPKFLKVRNTLISPPNLWFMLLAVAAPRAWRGRLRTWLGIAPITNSLFLFLFFSKRICSFPFWQI